MIPPILLSGIRRLRQGPPPPPEWKVIPTEAAQWQNSGWLHASIIETQRRKWPKYLTSVQAPNPLAVPHESPEVSSVDVLTHNLLMSYAYVLGRVAAERKRVRLLDWGCGAGHYFPLSKGLFPDADIEYNGFDWPDLVSLGSELNPEANFFRNPSECWQQKYDLVLASGSLQYAQDWRSLLRKFSGSAEGYVFVTRLPVVLDGPSFVLRQDVRRYGYETFYDGWVFNRQEFLAEVAAQGLILEREFLLFTDLSVENIPEQVGHRAYLFRKN